MYKAVILEKCYPQHQRNAMYTAHIGCHFFYKKNIGYVTVAYYCAFVNETLSNKTEKYTVSGENP